MQVLHVDLHEASWPIASGMSSLCDICAHGHSSLGTMSPQYARIMDTLAMIAMRGEDTNMTVDICGTQMVVNLVYANDDRDLASYTNIPTLVCGASNLQHPCRACLMNWHTFVCGAISLQHSYRVCFFFFVIIDVS